MKYLQYLNILSIDVVLGAISCSAFFSLIWGVNPSWQSLLLLGSAVWLIYTFDHLKDARETGKLDLTVRHSFHRTHFNKLLMSSLGVIVLCVYLIFTMPPKTLMMGAGLLALVSIYFITLHYLSGKARFHKEVIIAFLYATGVFIPLLSTIEEFSLSLLLHIIQLAGIALANLLIFSFIEYETDRHAGYPSMLEIVPRNLHKGFIMIFMLLQLSFSLLVMFISEYPQVQIVLSVMITMLLLLIHTSDDFKGVKFRLMGDAVFLIPALPVMFIWFSGDQF